METMGTSKSYVAGLESRVADLTAEVERLTEREDRVAQALGLDLLGLIRERDQARARGDRLQAVLEYIRDHGETHETPCHALHRGDCADVMQGVARAALDAALTTTEETTG